VLEFIEIQAFTNRLRALAGKYADEVLLEIQNDLLENPERGATVAGTGGARKARVADPVRRKGKRGGFRYLYYYIERDGQIVLLMIFNKDEQDDLDALQKRMLQQAILRLKEAK
jgi:mRNA-degrading endonuclease RelE of RelBE toxin-antitoxin system